MSPLSFNALAIRRNLGLDQWSIPLPFGPDGVIIHHTGYQQSHNIMAAIITCAEHDGTEWLHASIAGREATPSYSDLAMLARAVWGEQGYAYQAFVPTDHHVNIHPRALHLWGRLDGAAVLPEFDGLVNGVRTI